MQNASGWGIFSGANASNASTCYTLLVQRTSMQQWNPFTWNSACLFTPNLARSTPNINLVLPKVCLVQLTWPFSVTMLHHILLHSCTLLNMNLLVCFFLFFFCCCCCCWCCSASFFAFFLCWGAQFIARLQPASILLAYKTICTPSSSLQVIHQWKTKGYKSVSAGHTYLCSVGLWGLVVVVWWVL